MEYGLTPGLRLRICQMTQRLEHIGFLLAVVGLRRKLKQRAICGSQYK